jgi:hypothetical protein
MFDSSYFACLLIAQKLQIGWKLSVEVDLVDPVFHFALGAGKEQEFRAVGTAQSEDVFLFGVVLCLFALGFVDDDGRRGCLALDKVVQVFEEAQQLSTKN